VSSSNTWLTISKKDWQLVRLDQMKVWIIQIGEPTPTETGNGDRIMRSGMLATWLAKRGNVVTWWASTFDHARKEYRQKAACFYEWQLGVTIRYLHSSKPYRKNLSLARIINHREIALDFRRTIEGLEPPDLILSCMPTPELCVEAVRYGKKTGVPVLLDVRDLWPDDMVRLAPKMMHWAMRLLARPIALSVAQACRGAAGICATSPIYVDWGLRLAARERNGLDADFPLGYSDQCPSVLEQKQAREYWSEQGVSGDESEFIICFFGALGVTCLLRPAIDVSRRLAAEGRKTRLIICGRGDRYDEVKAYAKGAENVLFTGWIGRPEIWTLMRFAHVGLVPVKNIFSYMSNLPNKTIEYMSAGLPLLSSLKGLVGELIVGEGIGLTYGEDDTVDLYQKVCRLMDRHDERASMARNSRALFENRFSAGIVYGAFSEHLENAVK
jgi:glycosyltransferase involved in cell wall biosynthesis